MFGLIRGAARGVGRREPGRYEDAREGVQIRFVEWGAGHDAGPVRVKAGLPVLLIFQRLDTDPRCDCVAIPALGRLSTLSRRSSVELPPCPVGEYGLCSKDGVAHATLVVEP
jgi:plastocyanin domain-containing protein